MDKKGALFHWLIFGVLAALGIFLFSTLYFGGAVKTKSQWPVDFLKQSFYPAEKELLKIDLVAKEAGLITAKELALQGGFTDDSACGTFQGANLWNNQEKTCFPDPGKNLTLLFNQKFSELLPGKEFSEVTSKSYILSGKGETETKISRKNNYQQYRYETGFAVNLGYDFDEYSELKIAATQLLNTCRNSKILSVCLKETKPESWKDGSCLGDSFSEERKTFFCLVSASKPEIKYFLALDFTPGKALAVTGTKITAVNGKFQIKFEKDALAESYNLHYTNWPGVKDKSGSPEDIFSNMPTAAEFGYFHQTVKLANPPAENCPEEKAAGTVYLCGEELVYILEDGALEENKEYWFGAASMKAGAESEIILFTPN